MCKSLRLCLDLNIWCAALLADLKGNQHSACQSIVDFVRSGQYASGKIELIISSIEIGGQCIALQVS